MRPVHGGGRPHVKRESMPSVAKRVGFPLCLVVCALGLGAGHAHADGTPPATPIADGVQIGSVVVGGRRAGEATAAVQTAYFAPVVVHVGHHNVSVSPHRFHTALDVATAVQTALTAAADTIVPLRPTFDMQRIVNWVGTLASKTDSAPVAGTVILRNSRPVLTHSRPGRELEKFATRMRIRAAVVTGERTTVVVAPLRTLAATSAKAEPIIVIHRGSNHLYLYDGVRLVRSFPVATGQPAWPTPLGHFEIVVKQVNPWWFPPPQDSGAAGAKPVPPGPGNPLGTRWMGLSAPGVGIHGTSEPSSVGHSGGAGCIRMQIPSAEWLFTRVRIGTPVFIVPA